MSQQASKTVNNFYTFAGRPVAALALIAAAGLTGCEHDGYLDPRQVGRWEHTPTSVPVLTRLACVEDPAVAGVDVGSGYGEPSRISREDLIPEVDAYRGGPGDKQKLGDNKTPVGTYRIIDVKDKTRFDTFIQINYPNVKDAFYGLRSSVISRGEFDRIVQALRHGQVPPQNTRLGGAIGIHGLTEETPEALHIQDKVNWTEGCIALRNEDLHDLRPYIDVGTRVVIRE